MVALRRLDAFTKTRPDLQEKSAVGGLITLVAAATAGILFVGQITIYTMGGTHHALQLSRSTSIPLIPLDHSKVSNKIDRMGRMPLKLHITFPHVSCDKLDVIHDGVSLSSGELDKMHRGHSIKLRKPTSAELNQIFGKKSTKSVGEGCTIDGSLRPHIVAGVLTISLSRRAWSAAATTLQLALGTSIDVEMKRAMQQYNVSHYIHKIEFGKPFAHAQHKPLENVKHIIDNDFYGIAVAQTLVKLVPTVSQGFVFEENSYQTSVVDNIIQPQTLVAQGVQQLPGLVISYDFIPLTVHHNQGRDNFLVFLSSLISIVGGAFVTVAMLTGCLVHSAQAVAKKID